MDTLYKFLTWLSPAVPPMLLFVEGQTYFKDYWLDAPLLVLIIEKIYLLGLLAWNINELKSFFKQNKE